MNINKVINIAVCHSDYKVRKKNKRKVIRELFHLRKGFHVRESFDIINTINRTIIYNKRFSMNNNKFYEAALNIVIDNGISPNFKKLNEILEKCDGSKIEESEIINAVYIDNRS